MPGASGGILLGMQTPMPPQCCEDGLPEPEALTGEQIASVGKALGHPARVAILEFFKECRPHVAGEVVAQLPLAQSTVSEHLRILREADLLFSTEDGPRTWYCMRRSVLHRFSQAVETLTEDSRTAIVQLATPGRDT